MAKGEFDMFFLCAGVGWRGAMIFSSDKSMTVEGGSEKKYPAMIREGASKK